MRILFLLMLSVSLCFMACSRHSVNNDAVGNKFGYGDSVFYIKNTSYTVLPVNGKPGTYTAFPDNLKIDNNTGAITITLKGNDGQSQTGLRYKIKYTNNSNETDSTYVTISGITYVDRFYNLSQNDSIIRPVYNADVVSELPPGNYNVASDNKLALDASNGQINIRETIRRGFFDNQINTSWKQTTIKYAANDKSNGVNNSIDVILYYYNSVNEVPSNVSALMQAHQRMMVGISSPIIPATIGSIDNNLSSDLSLFKPRPPCIIIVGH
jgi:hypothetical protein